MLQAYQHLPEQIDPIVLTVGLFPLRWYSLMYLAGFMAVYFLLKYRVRRGEYKAFKFPITSAAADKAQNLIFDLLICCFVGLLIGARLGYVIFYNLDYFITHPLEIFIPIRVTSYELQVMGIYGMSYFGGLVGVLCAGYVFARKNTLDFWQLADFVAPAVPAGYFFGRIGNFLNGELYGRPTEKIWGMYFSGDPAGLLRHPSQLYEALFEGAALFAILWLVRNNEKIIACHWLFPGYLFGYGFFRFWIEFFREPDSQLGLFSGLTLGQILALMLMAVAIVVGLWRRKKLCYN